jgi:hypothetical protein
MFAVAATPVIESPEASAMFGLPATATSGTAGSQESRPLKAVPGHFDHHRGGGDTGGDLVPFPHRQAGFLARAGQSGHFDDDGTQVVVGYSSDRST